MLNKLVVSSVRSRRLMYRAAAVAAVSFTAFAGCATEESAPEDAAQQEEGLALAAPIDRQATTPDPEQPFFSSVTANGTGCPKGTWGADVSSDGLTFTVNFERYEAQVGDGTRMAFKDCNLTVKLHSPAGLSYAISDFVYNGLVNLETGVSAFQTANYYFQGNPIPSVDKEKRTDLTGPVNAKIYYFQDTVRTDDLVWSPCGLDRNLNVVTRIGLQKAQNLGAGYINLSNFNGQIRGKVQFKLTYRKCATGGSSGGVR